MKDAITQKAESTANVTTALAKQMHEALVFFADKACAKAGLKQDDQLLMMAMVAVVEADMILRSIVGLCEDSADSGCAVMANAMAASIIGLHRNTLAAQLSKLTKFADASDA